MKGKYDVRNDERTYRSESKVQFISIGIEENVMRQLESIQILY